MIPEVRTYVAGRVAAAYNRFHTWVTTYTLAEWLLHLLAMIAGFTCTGVLGLWAWRYKSNQKVLDHVNPNGNDVMRDIPPNLVLVCLCGGTSFGLCLLFLFLFGSHAYVGWFTSLSQWLHQRRLAERFPRWHVANTAMNLSAVFVKNIRVDPMLIICSVSLSIVAMVGRAHQRRDPSGLTEGLTTCYLICFLTFYAEVVIEHLRKIPLLTTSLVTAILCLLCSVFPAPAPDGVPPPQPPPPPLPPSLSGQLENIQGQISSLREEFRKSKSTEQGGSSGIASAQGLEDELQAMSHQSQLLKDENSNLLQLNSSLEKEISTLSNASGEMKAKEEKLCNQLGTLQLEVNSLRSQKHVLEQKLQATSHESESLRAEKSKMLELQSSMEARENTLWNQLRNLQLEVDSLRRQKYGLKQKLEAMSYESEHLRDENSRIETLQKKQEDLLATVSKLQKEKGEFELSYKFSERRKAEAEHALEEKEASSENAEKEFHRERNSLKEQVGLLEKDISSAKRDTKDCLQKAVTVFNELEMTVQSSMVDDVSIISISTEEILDAKTWATGIGQMQERLQKKITALIEERDEKKANEVLLRKEVEGLEAMIKEERQEKEKLSSKVEDLEKNQKEIKARERVGEESARDDTDGAIGR